MPPSRPAHYYLGYMDSSVFLDFNNYDNERLYLVRISFDGYGCCELGEQSNPMTQEESKLFKSLMNDNISDQNTLLKIIKAVIARNKELHWLDALEEYHLT